MTECNILQSIRAAIYSYQAVTSMPGYCTVGASVINFAINCLYKLELPRVHLVSWVTSNHSISCCRDTYSARRVHQSEVLK